jgi:copper binding protein CusF
MRLRLGKSFVLLTLLIASWNLPSFTPAADRSVELRGTGVVVALLPPPSSLHATRPVIVIHHDPLLPLMPEAMEMPFLAASTALFANVRAGDRIVFTLRETPDALLVVAIERAGP